MRLNELHSFLIKTICFVSAATKPWLSAAVRKHLKWLTGDSKGNGALSMDIPK